MRRLLSIWSLPALVMLGGGGGALAAQSGALLWDAAHESPITVATASALVGAATETLSASVTPSDAPAELNALGFPAPQRDPSAPITIGEYSLLVMRVLDLPGGLIYGVFSTPRYALRELVAARIVPDTWRLGGYLSGAAAMRTLAAALEHRAATQQ